MPEEMPANTEEAEVVVINDLAERPVEGVVILDGATADLIALRAAALAFSRTGFVNDLCVEQLFRAASADDGLETSRWGAMTLAKLNQYDAIAAAEYKELADIDYLGLAIGNFSNRPINEYGQQTAHVGFKFHLRNVPPISIVTYGDSETYEIPDDKRIHHPPVLGVMVNYHTCSSTAVLTGCDVILCNYKFTQRVVWNHTVGNNGSLCIGTLREAFTAANAKVPPSAEAMLRLHAHFGVYNAASPGTRLPDPPYNALTELVASEAGRGFPGWRKVRQVIANDALGDIVIGAEADVTEAQDGNGHT